METREVVAKVMADSNIESFEQMDSLDTLDLCLALEKELGVSIPDSALAKVKTEDDLVEMLDGLRATV